MTTIRFAPRVAMCLVAGLAALSCCGIAHAQTAGGELRAVEIIDATGFGEPVVAAIVEIPAGWQPRGGMQWDRRTNCVGNQMRLEWSAASRDGAHAFEIMHGLSWQVQGTQIPMSPCPALPFDSARAFLSAVVQQQRPGAQLLDWRDRPDIAEAAARASSADARVRARDEAGELLIGYRSNGVEFREVLGATVRFTEMQGNVMGSTSMVFAQRAPRGQLDFAVGERIAASLKTNPHWFALMRDSVGTAERRFSANQRDEIMRWHAAEMAKINAKGAADRAAIRAEGNRAVADINRRTYENTQTTNDDMQRRNLEAIGEYNTYQNPDSGARVRSSIHGGERVLQNPSGSSFSTNDPYLNPPGSTELQRVR